MPAQLKGFNTLEVLILAVVHAISALPNLRSETLSRRDVRSGQVQTVAARALCCGWSWVARSPSPAALSWGRTTSTPTTSNRTRSALAAYNRACPFNSTVHDHQLGLFGVHQATLRNTATLERVPSTVVM